MSTRCPTVKYLALRKLGKIPVGKQVHRKGEESDSPVEVQVRIEWIDCLRLAEAFERLWVTWDKGSENHMGANILRKCDFTRSIQHSWS